MQALYELLRESAALNRLRKEVFEGVAACAIGGVVKGARATVLAALAQPFKRPLLIVCPTPQAADQLSSDLEILLGEPEPRTTNHEPRLCLFPPASSTFGAIETAAVKARLAALDALHRLPNPILVTSLAALCHPTVPKAAFERCRLDVNFGDELDIAEFIPMLLAGGYERVHQVTLPGQFSVRGGILDIFSPAHDAAVRIELFGDKVESLRAFDVQTQRSTQPIPSCRIIPAREFVMPVDEIHPLISRIAQKLDAEVEALRQAGKKEQARLLKEHVDFDLQRLAELHYFEGSEWYFPFVYQKLPYLFDHQPEGTCLVLIEPKELEFEHSELMSRWEELSESLIATGDLLAPPTPPLLNWDEFLHQCQRFQRVEVTTEAEDESRITNHESRITLQTHHVEAFSGQPRRLLRRLAEWTQRRFAVAVCTRFAERVMEMVSEGRDALEEPFALVKAERHQKLLPGCVLVFDQTLSSGFSCPQASIVVITDAELFGHAFVKRRRKKLKMVSPIASPDQLREGDYVVHINHGIGIYRGIIRQKVLNAEGDYLTIEYAGGDKLYVPVNQIDRVQKFLGADGHEPALSSLSSNRWLKTKQRVKKKVEEVAQELAELYALREVAEGFAFSPDSPWQREMEEAFAYEETEDQEQAIREVKKDMERPKPMDRLVCGDVGFGKTEIGIRAAFKAVQDSKQVAVLCPTTVLAQQHFNTFSQRLAPYPVRIEMLSRFRSPKEQKQVLEGLRVGSVDIVIGTHRILSEDVHFKELGLLIVDEEQRFGVKQKERLKKLKASVDVLTLTATPIPRTMHMALGSLREMSLINDPPQGRRPVRTYLSQYDEDLIRYAIARELERGGQVYYVHNRVQGIEHVAEKVRRLVPNARIDIGHGQMPEDELERVMMDFYQGKVDVLVCTTIIENGLDVPNANTLIVENCERFGLAQLYQLRGRVGRSDRQAYAYFFHAHPKRLSHHARMRLEAIREFTDLGSGFRLALRDLEIRGAGNLLGVEQHGFINEIGFELYSQMLSEAVQRIKGEPIQPKIELPQADLPVQAFIPEDYIEDLEHRLHFYRRMAVVQSEEEISDIAAELKDRFGEPPVEVQNLLSILRIRLRAYRAVIAYINHDGQFVLVKFFGARQLSDVAVARLYAELRKSYSKSTLDAVRLYRDHVSIEYALMSQLTLLRLLEDLLALLAESPPVPVGEAVARA